MTWRFAWFAASILILGLSLSSCGDENDIEVHAPIWGYVTGPDGPLSARVEALDLSSSAFTNTDADGRYELPVAAGNYEIRVEIENLPGIYYLADGTFGWPDWTENRPSLVEVEPLTNSLRVDIRLSSAQITVEGLDFWEGREIVAELGLADATARVLGGRATITFPLIAPGNYFLELEHALVPGTYSPDDATRFSFAAGERAVIQTAMTVEPAIVRGSFVDPLGFDPWLSCVVPGSRFEARPDSAERFSVAVWANWVELSAAGFGLSSRADGIRDRFSLIPGEILDLPPFPLPGVRVMPVGASFDPDGIVFWIRGDEDGDLRDWEDYGPPFALGPLPFGSYLLGAEHGTACREDWIPTLCDSSDVCDAVSIEVDASDPSPTVSFPLRRGATIDGLIFEHPDDVRVHLVWEDQSYCDGGRIVLRDGFFTLSGLRPGSYRLQFELDDHSILWYPGVESEAEAEIIEIRDDEERIQIEMTWPK